MAATVDVVEFTLGNERYALDINLVREIVEMMPITPIPRAPSYITGVINLRGEITNIMNLNTLLSLKGRKAEKSQKIIVFMPEAAGGNNVGVTVDTVTSVTPVSEDEVERSNGGTEGGRENYIKGIIKIQSGEGQAAEKRLVLWLDVQKVLAEIVTK
jgi:purine-binding chemotaxis protein CheW